MKVINERSISLPELDNYVQEMKKRDKELNFRAKKVEEYLKVVPKTKDYKKLTKELEDAQIQRLKPKLITLIINILPEDTDSLKTILTGENITLKEEDLKKIVDIVKKHV
nr:hypothetical protein [Nanoarchaeum sp.]